ncbi:RES family NAD+ phosphorylase [Phocaeicola sp.]
MKLCANCFQDEEIKNYISSNAHEVGYCDYCGKNSNLLDVSELLDFFTEFIGIFQPSKEGTPFIELIQKDWKLFDTEGVGSSLLTDILKLIGVSLSSYSLVEYLPEIAECVSYWETLKQDLKWEKRYLTDHESLSEYGWDAILTPSLQIDSRNTLYRARINTEDSEECISKEEMGCPPRKLAKGGRANPHGIPYLYLAREVQTTVYETRSLFLDVLSIGSFRVSDGETLKLVDFTTGESPLNYDNMIQQTKGRLLRAVISKDLSKPMRRFDSEIEYIPTQFICEYIRHIIGADGIQFNSSLHESGINMVVFNAHKLKCMNVELYKVQSVHMEIEGC